VIICCISIDPLAAQTNPGDQYERRYPVTRTEVIPTSTIPLGNGHAFLGLEVQSNGDQDRVVVTFLDSKGTISSSYEYNYGDDVQILEAGDLIELSDGTLAFSAILAKDSLNKAITRIDRQGNIAWTELTGQESDNNNLRSSKSVLLEVPNEKIWHAHIVDAIGSTTDIQITEFDFLGNKTAIRTLNVGTDNRPVSDEDILDMSLAIDSTVTW